ncbi:MAG: PA0069 family radical SAM protein [Bacteroidia bacterium]|nr:PA0069 family radical SAM protein [Bacteroidia bacterium]
MSDLPHTLKGRGAQLNVSNPFHAQSYVQEHVEGLDEPYYENIPTEIIDEFPKRIINKVDSPDIPMNWSMNPYQGCEHGCIYCYARNSHHYWGFSAGLDFERKIVVKRNAAEILESQLRSPNWQGDPIMFSGNTDCYQPVERELKITRSMLEVLLKYRQPVGIITKNSLILRDIDLISKMAKEGLVHVMVSLTTLDETIRQKMEPRTATGIKRLQVIRELTNQRIPVGVMVAPIIPGLTSHEVPNLIKRAAENGALSAGYTMVRLNGAIAEIFEDWLQKTYPEKADKVLSQIRETRGGKLNESRFGARMRGEGEVADSIRKLFHVARDRFLGGRRMPEFNLQAFRPLDRGGQMSLF